MKGIPHAVALLESAGWVKGGVLLKEMGRAPLAAPKMVKVLGLGAREFVSVGLGDAGRRNVVMVSASAAWRIRQEIAARNQPTEDQKADEPNEADDAHDAEQAAETAKGVKQDWIEWREGLSARIHNLRMEVGAAHQTASAALAEAKAIRADAEHPAKMHQWCLNQITELRRQIDQQSASLKETSRQIEHQTATINKLQAEIRQLVEEWRK